MAWLQSVEDASVALAVISPRRFFPEYRVHATQRQLAPLEIGSRDSVHVLTVVNQNHGRLTTNLKAPLVLNLRHRTGRQVVVCDEQPLRQVLPEPPARLRRSA